MKTHGSFVLNPVKVSANKIWTMEFVNFVLFSTILISFGLCVTCKANTCQNTTTLECPKIEREQRQMMKDIPATCYKSTKTCWFLNFLGINCKYKQRSYGCSKKVSYFETITVTMRGCCPGYYQESADCCVQEQCKRGYWGQNCTNNCSCEEVGYERCDINGTCLCKAGWIGSRCSTECVSGTYGMDCQWNCSCDNGAACNHVTGECNCTSVVGWTGERCEVECPRGSFGNNCSGVCNCEYENQECSKTTGECRCPPGKSGRDCSLNCSTESFTFGTNCSESCRCIQQNSVTCNPVTGSCNCKPGWTGDQCEKRCHTSKYGEGCLKNCKCSDTEICDSVNGTCLLADICFADYTSNCIPLKNVSCSQLKEDCSKLTVNYSSNTLIKTLSDICCTKKRFQTLCISTGKCKCLRGYSGNSCQEILSMDTKQVADRLKSGVSSSVVVTVTVISVLVLTAVVVIAVLWRRKGGINTKKKDNKSAHNQVYGKPVLDNVTGQGSDQRPQEESQLEMNILNQDDVNNYGYDVSARDSRNKENEIYSKNLGDMYDHLERNSSNGPNNIDETYSHAQQNSSNGPNNIDETYSHAQQNSSNDPNNIDETYSHAQQNSSNGANSRDKTYSHAMPALVDDNEYDTAGVHHVPSDCVYDHTNNQDQIYSNQITENKS
ncbi:protein draper-like [Saccostrea cucullata]|uniref:protein draper-like n=1 Tax=Saccostrea cuccullata TaxID=36930 RepID=UPI002ED3404D